MTTTNPNKNINQGTEDTISCKLVSEIIRTRIKADKARYHANDNISKYIFPGELETLEKEVASRVRDLLETLLIDVDNLLKVCSMVAPFLLELFLGLKVFLAFLSSLGPLYL